MTAVLLRLPAVKARVGLSTSEIYKRAACGRFPRQIHLDGRSVAWLASDIERWIAERITAQRRGLQPTGRSPR